MNRNLISYNTLYTTMNLRNLPGILLVRLSLAVAFGVAAIVALAASLPMLLLDPVLRRLCLRRSSGSIFLTV